MTTQRIGKIVGSVAVSSALLLSGAALTFAQTTGGTSTTGTGSSMTGSTGTMGTGTTGTTPGVPNTGAGGDATTNLAILGVAAIVAVGGAAYLARQKYVSR